MIRRSLCLLLFVCFAAVVRADDPVDFNRDIRPILSNKCFKCHGPDEKQREAGLRLDEADGFTAKLESGATPVVPGDLEKSALVQRVTSDDEFTRMPPPDADKQLTKKEIDLLVRWVKEGGKYAGHWAWIPPRKPDVPDVMDATFVRTPIDSFVLRKLNQHGLKPNPEADKETLIRRVTLDLTGLPPTIQEIDNFLKDDSPDAYETLVDRLLDSPRYGEHMARYWLDAARYGDTHGLHLDNVRSIWPYREWVINAFNNNKPFDQFTVEQIAGDLLPEPTLDQRIATGFNRCNVTTSEGGSIDEEYYVRYAVDRVETTSTVFLGVSMGCAVCHDHKYDPFTMTDFYSMFAYFFSLTEKAMDGNQNLPPPIVKVPSPEQKRQKEEYARRIAEVKQKIDKTLADIRYVDPTPEATEVPARQDYVWIEDELPDGAKAQGNTPWEFVSKSDKPVYSGERSSTRTAADLSQHFFTDAAPPLEVGPGDKLFAYVYLDPDNPPQEIMLQFNDGSWEHRAIWGGNKIDWGQNGTASRQRIGDLPKPGEWVRLEVPIAKVGLKPGSKLNGWAFTQFGGTVYWDHAGINTQTPQGNMAFDSFASWDATFRGIKGRGLPKEIANLINVAPEKRNDAQKKQLSDYFVRQVWSGTRETLGPLNTELARLEDAQKKLEAQIPGTLVMEDRKEPRQAYVLIRGQYDHPDKDRPVSPNTPASLPPLPKGAPPNRLALARWLVSADNPLTARVTVNRFWQRYFGTGLVKTAEDFGSQGEWPSHPELLDWLAVQFRESGWDVKAMQKMIVMSGAYRQSSQVTPDKLHADPHNRLISRGPRFRLDAEAVRDGALFISGLLIERVGGESVKPYQPDGLWKAVGYTGSNTVKFVQEHGDKLYRRSMYTFWKRTAPPPTMAIFDAPSRESCTVRRERTNTPLQALVLMNDVQFVEASRMFAERIMQEGGATPKERIVFAFRTATSRKPGEDEVAVLLNLFENYRKQFAADKPGAEKLLSVGEYPRNTALDVTQHAAWTLIANLLLNLDETVTKG